MEATGGPGGQLAGTCDALGYRAWRTRKRHPWADDSVGLFTHHSAHAPIPLRRLCGPPPRPRSCRPSASAVTAKVAVGNSSAGSILVDGHGKSLYRFGRDTGRKSTCNGACAQNWPPLLTSKTPPKAGTGVSARKLGTTRRSDGKLQVTYAGHPLYNFVGDATRGDINGQGLNAFGGIWTLVAPSGAKISPGASQSSPAPSPTPPPSPTPGFPY